MRTRYRLVLPALLVILAAAPSISTAGPQAPPDARPSPLLPIPNARIPVAGVLSGGQPTPDQFDEAAAAGYRTIINLRTDSEKGFEWEPDRVRQLGMSYVSIPVPGAAGLTRDTVVRLDAALRAAQEKGPVLLHCGSGNRIGALLALRRAWLENAAPEAALKYGVASGLTRLEPETRKLLGLPAEKSSKR